MSWKQIIKLNPTEGDDHVEEWLEEVIEAFNEDENFEDTQFQQVMVTRLQSRLDTLKQYPRDWGLEGIANDRALYEAYIFIQRMQSLFVRLHSEQPNLYPEPLDLKGDPIFTQLKNYVRRTRGGQE
jgi:hypothetical protein